jgi:hypothetical protein
MPVIVKYYLRTNTAEEVASVIESTGRKDLPFKTDVAEDKITRFSLYSGLSQKAYSRQKNRRDNQLTYWKKRFVKGEAPVSFV